jgi:catechol 2,3-dioxygenase-like lactoylglutathione lyase family enzyme
MLVNGVDGILISVKDLDKSISFCKDGLGLELVAKVEAAPAELTGLWGLEESVSAKTACLKHPEQSTLLRLMEFSDQPGKYIRDGHNVYDYACSTSPSGPRRWIRRWPP